MFKLHFKSDKTVNMENCKTETAVQKDQRVVKVIKFFEISLKLNCNPRRFSSHILYNARQWKSNFRKFPTQFLKVEQKDTKQY